MTLNAYIIPGLKKGMMPILYTEKSITPEEIIVAVAAYFSMNPEDLFIKRRNRGRVYARQIAIYLIRKRTLLTLVETYKLFKGAINDHTTVIHSVKLINDLLGYNEQTKIDVDSITNILTPTIHEANQRDNA